MMMMMMIGAGVESRVPTNIRDPFLIHVSHRDDDDGKKTPPPVQDPYPVPEEESPSVHHFSTSFGCSQKR